MTFPLELALLTAAVLMLVSVFASKLSDRFAVPALLFFLVIGMLAGSEGPGGIYFDNNQIAKSVGTVALIFILFLGGIDTTWKQVRPVLSPGVLLSTLGVLVTLLVVGGAAVGVLGFSLPEGLLLGAIVSSTDAAAVFGVLRSRRLAFKGNIRPLLEFESGSNDPMAVFLTVTLIGVVAGNVPTAPEMLAALVLNMGAGALAGGLMARVAEMAINKIRLEYEGLYPVLTVSLVLLTYALAVFLEGNGFLAVYLLGLLLSRKDLAHKRALIRFHEGIAWLMQIIMFLTLGLLVVPSRLVPVMGSGLLVAAVLMFLARPLAVFLCLAPFRFTWAEKLLVSWVGLRGAVPVILATFPLLAGTSQAGTIFYMVFFVVLASVLLQGTTLPFVARVLGVLAPFDPKRRFPIEFDQTEGIDASLEDIIVPYNTAVEGKTISELGVPARALVVLMSRGEKFIVPSGSTVISGGDVLLVLANEADLKTLQKKLAVAARAQEGDVSREERE